MSSSDFIGLKESKKLERVLQGLLPSFTEELPPIHKHVNVYLEESGKRPINPTTMGRFYESLTRGLYGGVEVGDRLRSLSSRQIDLIGELENTPNGCSEIERLVKPDGICKNGKIIWEAKGTRWNHRLNLLDRQILRYIDLQKTYQDFAIFFAIYGHTFYGIKKEGSDEETLIEDLAIGTKYMVRLPLSIILNLHGMFNGKFNSDLVKQYTEKTEKGRKVYPSCTVVNAGVMRKILENPQQIISSLDLDPEDYTYQRFVSPTDFYVNKNQVLQYPILAIKDKNHKAWVNYFMEQERVMREKESEPIIGYDGRTIL